MKRVQALRAGTLILVAGWAGSSGCTHNYYYGAVPPCLEPGAPTVVSNYGAVCDVPTQVVGGTVVPAPGPSRVVVSEPLDPLPPARSGSRIAWRRLDPENLATTKVDGALGDTVIDR